MLIKEAVEEINTPRRMTVQVVAADLDPHAIERARQGLYPETIAADVTPERLARFFVREEAASASTSRFARAWSSHHLT